MYMNNLKIDDSFMYRHVNVGLSGGERKKSELLQILLLEPTFIILDEIDSGVDTDSVKIIAQKINELKNINRTILLITHYPKILHLVVPNYIHILNGGKIEKTSNYELALKVEKNGYM